MAVLKKDTEGNELFVDCMCGCGDSMRLSISKDEDLYGYYAIMTYMKGCKNDSVWRTFCKKLKKIWAIIRNKDYYYSDILMTKEDYEMFKEYINKF